MALPSSAYATATIPKPDSDEADYSFLIDLSQLPQALWDEFNSDDGGRMRFAKDADESELAFDVIELDSTAQTGKVRVLWSGTASSVTNQTIRLYPAQTGNTLYIETDTFGADNAYNSGWESYYPKGGGADRTSNDRDGTTVGGATIGGVVGQIGTATDFDGADDYVDIPDVTLTNLMTVFCVASGGAGVDSFQHLMGDHPGWFISRDNGSASMRFGISTTNNTNNNISFNIEGQNSGFNLYTARYNGAQAAAILNGVSQTASAVTGNMDMTGDAMIGTYGGAPTNTSWLWDGTIQEAQIHSVARSDAWIDLEHRLIFTNSTEWGTWTVEGGSSAFEASFSIDSALQASSSSVSTAEAGISLDTGADVSDGSTATGESLLSIAHAQDASTQSASQAESSMSLSNLLQTAFSKQSVTDASFSMPVVHQVTTVSDTQIVNEASFSLALSKAITTTQISTIEVSYSLNSAQQASVSSDATGEAQMAINLQAGLSFISSALAEAGISFNAVQSLTFTGQTVGVDVTLADGRTLTIALYNRTFTIPEDNRTYTILADNRTLNIEP